MNLEMNFEESEYIEKPWRRPTTKSSEDSWRRARQDIQSRQALIMLRAMCLKAGRHVSNWNGLEPAHVPEAAVIAVLSSQLPSQQIMGHQDYESHQVFTGNHEEESM